MKNFLRKATSLFLSLLLASSLLAVPAGASYALGEDLTQEDTLVSESTVLSTNVFWSTAYSDLRRENLITYSPNRFVTPMVTYGSTLTSCSTVGAAARELEAQGYRVVAGINGDFYNVSTGLPIGLVVSEGEVKSSDAGYYAIGFREDGSAVLGKPGLTVTADLGYLGYDASGYGAEIVRNITGINKARVSTGGIYLYTYDFNAKHTTGNTESGVDVVCSVQEGSLSIGGTLTLQVEEVIHAASATPIQPGQVVLSANSQSGSYYVDALANETAGNLITVTVSASGQGWEDVDYAVGALYALLQDGSMVSGLPTDVNPRTAVGQKPDGTLVFYTIDGRQSGLSIGASMSQVAERLLELGCVTALCLDGGGSTTLAVTTPDKTASSTINSPSGGSQRAVSNQIFLVSSSEPSGDLSHFYVSPSSRYVLAGSTVDVAVSAVDTNYIPMDSRYTLNADSGVLDETEDTLGNTIHRLTTPAGGGDVTVTASRNGASGSAVVHAVTTPDSITVKNGSTAVSSLTLTPGSSLRLSASAVYRHQALKADANAFTWALTGGIGSVDENGVLTAATPGTGTLTVSAGGKSVSVAVTVSKVALSTLEDFESGIPALASYSYGGTLSSNTDSAFVKLGRASGRLDYTLGSDGTASVIFETPYSMGSAYTQLNLWLLGDNSGGTLYLLTTDGTSTAETELTSLDFVDGQWRQLSAVLPTGTAAVTGFKIAGMEAYMVEEQLITYPHSTGTLYLDQLTASYNGITDNTPPVVTLTGEDTRLTASVNDGADGVLPRSAVSVTWDGNPQDFTYNESTGVLSTSVLSDGGPHRITVTARDASGNIGRASYDVPVPEDWTHRFSDTQDYWAADYVDYLYTSGVTTGYDDGTFRPNQNITRAQFAAMLYRYLKLDESKYADVVLPFADLSAIPEYALPAIRALYTEGIINGTAGKDGQLYFNPGSSLTRAQAATMIGRTQEKGYALSPLTFSDAASIPAYAAYYIQTMAAQGIIGGYTDGSFKPNANITRGQMAKILFNLM